MSKDHTGFPGGILDIESLRQRASAATVAEPSDAIDRVRRLCCDEAGSTVTITKVDARALIGKIDALNTKAAMAAQQQEPSTQSEAVWKNGYECGLEAGKKAAQQQAEPSEESASYKRMFEDAVRSLAAIDEALGIDPDEAGGAAPILEAIKQLQAAQQQAEPSHADSFASKAVYATAIADAQQAEPESVIKRQAQKIGELIADRDSWIEAHARLYRLYHDQSPKAGEEIHVNVEGGDVYTLPLQRSGMDKPRFVVHVPCSEQAEPGADERAAFEAWASKRRMDLRREANNPDEYLLASTADAFVGWQAHAAQSGQRAGVAEDANLLRDAAEKGLDINQQPQLGCVEVWAGKGDDALVFREYYSGHADREAATKCALKRALAAPTQQQEGGS